MAGVSQRSFSIRGQSVQASIKERFFFGCQRLVFVKPIFAIELSEFLRTHVEDLTSIREIVNQNYVTGRFPTCDGQLTPIA